MSLEKRFLGNWITAVIVLIYPLLWILFPPMGDLFYDIGHTIGETLSGTAMILMSIGVTMSIRPKQLEPWFGGLDKMYVTHRTVNTAAAGLLIGHFFTIPISETGGPGLVIGFIAFWAILGITLLTLLPKIPYLNRLPQLSYRYWRRIHQFLGLVFILGFVHYLMVEPITLVSAPGFYMSIISVMAGIGWLIFRWNARQDSKHPYEVEAVNRINSTIAEVVLKPLGNKLDHTAGQFMFIAFNDDEVLKEPHPFTISSAPTDDRLKLSIRSCGDWTQHLYDHLKPGMKASISGAHGQFNYKTGNDNQIWIAGGIGVTPFTSWTRDLNGSSGKQIDFFYSVRNEGDVLFWDEFEAAAAANDGLSLHKKVSDRDGRLSVDKIAAEIGGNLADRSIYMCGPAKMVESFAAEFKKRGVPSNQIHFEEFNFR